MKKVVGLILAVCMLALVPMLALAETMYVNTPNGGGVNVRSGPSADYDAIGYAAFGEAVDVLEVVFGSSFVNVNANGVYGYIALRYLSYDRPMPGPLPTYVPAPTKHPNPTQRPSPTKQPSGGSSLEKTLASMFAGFQAKGYEAVVVPSTPTNFVNLRWGPSKSAPVRSQYWAGNTVQVISENGEWAEVYDATNNVHGFMMKRFLKPSTLGSGSDS